MNLIAKEYIASRSDTTGVLILSEMAGAAKELGEAVIINPNNREEIANALNEALEMAKEEQIRRNSIMQNRLRRYDVIKWANDFLDELRAAKRADTVIYAKLLKSTIREALVQQYKHSARRLLLLDYDGTLVGFTRRPKDAKPSDNLLRLLGLLAHDTKNEVILISGRKKEDLQDWFGGLTLNLAAEHGTWIKEKSTDWKLLKPMSQDWKQKISPILETYSDRLPGAFIEEKDYSLAWHYRASDPEQGEQTARELMDDLVAFTANIEVQVLQGSKVIEVRNAGVNKGAAAQHWLTKNPYDFILAIGDDWTDEDLFAAISEDAFSIHVGFHRTRAKYQLRNPHDVIQLLQQIST
jgi:trehalose 6-phosphate synthase/phosphatase